MMSSPKKRPWVRAFKSKSETPAITSRCFDQDFHRSSTSCVSSSNSCLMSSVMDVKWSWLRRQRSGIGSPFAMGGSGSRALFIRLTEPLRPITLPRVHPSSSYGWRLKRLMPDKPSFLNRDSTADDWVRTCLVARKKTAAPSVLCVLIANTTTPWAQRPANNATTPSTSPLANSRWRNRRPLVRRS